MSSTGRISLNRGLVGWMATAMLVAGEIGVAAKTSGSRGTLSPREAFDIGVEAYVFGYPLVTMEMTRSLMTNVREPEGTRAPMGQFARVRTFPLASDHNIAVPNADTLYTSVWLDVSREPWVLSLPDPKGRFCLFSLVDGWTTVLAMPGKRTTGNGPQKLVITGPGWTGKLPAGSERCKSPTGLVWVVGRVHCAGTPEDYAAVHAFQDQCSAVPLSSHGPPYSPTLAQVDSGIDMRKSANEQIGSLGVADYFTLLAKLMKENPPAPGDAPIVKKMARLGIVPGQPFDISGLDAERIQVLQSVSSAALAKMMDPLRKTDKSGDWTFQNGWMWTLRTGSYGTDYTQRALVAAIGLGASRPEDSIIATSNVDGSGQAYSGNFRYVMHFAPRQAPSVKGFWSLTLYSGDHFFVSNPLRRYALTSFDPLKFNPDGSLDLYIEQHPPGVDRESNWLPAPEGKFILMLRFYRPGGSLLNGSWQIPPVKRSG